MMRLATPPRNKHQRRRGRAKAAEQTEQGNGAEEPSGPRGSVKEGQRNLARVYHQYHLLYYYSSQAPPR